MQGVVIKVGTGGSQLPVQTSQITVVNVGNYPVSISEDQNLQVEVWELEPNSSITLPAPGPYWAFSDYNNNVLVLPGAQYYSSSAGSLIDTYFDVPFELVNGDTVVSIPVGVKALKVVFSEPEISGNQLWGQLTVYNGNGGGNQSISNVITGVTPLEASNGGGYTSTAIINVDGNVTNTVSLVDNNGGSILSCQASYTPSTSYDDFEIPPWWDSGNISNGTSSIVIPGSNIPGYRKLSGLGLYLDSSTSTDYGYITAQGADLYRGNLNAIPGQKVEISWAKPRLLISPTLTLDYSLASTSTLYWWLWCS